MKNWKTLLVQPSTPIREAMLKIDTAGAQIAIVVDDDGKLLGTLSDGDIRRGFLKGLSLPDTVNKCMNRVPCAINTANSRDASVTLMRRLKLHQMPIIDDAQRVVGLEVLDDYLLPACRENWVVLMAGGLGTRLGDLTKSTPKPMLKVGDKPLLETIVRNFLNQGFKNFYFAVNYMAEVIEDHFGDGEKFGAQIRYLRENKRLGTVGALSLMPETPTEPLIVANGDLLADIDYSHMLDMHVDTEAVATMGVSEYEFQIPYGVVHEQGGDILHIEEKPTHKSLISAGIYVLSPAALKLVPKDQFFDMPTLFEQMIDRKMRSRVYQVHGYWLDIGRLPDYQKANSDISRVFQ